MRKRNRRSNLKNSKNLWCVKWISLPSWVVWTEYHPDGPESESSDGIHDSGLFFLGDNPYYMPIIINAQTGEMIDPKNKTKDRCMCPDLSAWQ